MALGAPSTRQAAAATVHGPSTPCAFGGPTRTPVPRPAVQIFVATADCEIGRGCRVTVTVQSKRDHAGRVSQVPNHQSASGVCRSCDVAHRVHTAGPEVDVREQQHRDALIEVCARCVSVVDQHELAPGRAGDAVGDVEVGRKIRSLGDDARSRRARGQHRHRRHQHLVKIHRRRVCDADLARASANQRGDLVADPLRQRDPPRAVPAPDEALAPFVVDDLGNAGRRLLRQDAKRIAVQIDDALGVVARQRELVAQCRQRIACIQLFALGAGVHACLRSLRCDSAPGRDLVERLAADVGHLRVVRGIADDEQQERPLVRRTTEELVEEPHRAGRMGQRRQPAWCSAAMRNPVAIPTDSTA